MEQHRLALYTDLYELTMGAGYHAAELDTLATFELFVRAMPSRNFLVAAGLEAALAYLETLHFHEDEIAYLRSLGMFDESYLELLANLRFEGDVFALPEGTVFFPNEPVVRVTAPRIQAQIIETYLLACINYQSLVASKAARITIAARGVPFVDFSGRRDHGPGAGVDAARASFIGGAAGTSSVVAGHRYGLQVSGTMAHSFVMSFATELEAFQAYLRAFPRGGTLLIDTYDTVQGARRALEAVQSMGDDVTLGAVRIDSGDLDATARAVRQVLDTAGFEGVRIFVSGDLDEYEIEQFVGDRVPVDAFGVGTQLGTSADAPYLPGVYKLVEDQAGAHLKLSSGKATLPGAKQVWRCYADGAMVSDTIALAQETRTGESPLLEHVMKQGKRTHGPESLGDMQARCMGELAALPPELRDLHREAAYSVEVSPALESLRRQIKGRYDDRPG